MPAPAVGATHDLSDEELNKLAGNTLITVTGSLIERNTRTTPAPLTILSRDDLNAFGRSTIGDILQQLPAQANGVNAQFNRGSDGSTRIDLRGLGSNRTLTLLNGRRFVSGGLGADTSVDLNTIPLAVIDRVEILKDGASAVYGSDAVGGVVNIITRTDFDGVETSLYTADTQRGDGFTYDASVIGGLHSKDKKANLIFSAGIQRQDPVFADARSFSRNAPGLASLSGPHGRIDAFSIDRNGDGIGDGSDLCGPGVQYCTSSKPGDFRPFLLPDDLYNDARTTYLYTPSSRYNLYTTGSYGVRSITGFFEASDLYRTSNQQSAPEPFSTIGNGIVISKDSIYNPLGGDILNFNRRLEELGLRRSLQDVNTFRLAGGIRGTIPDDAPAFNNWTWEVSYNYGRTDATGQSEGNLNLSRLANAIGPSFADAAGFHCGTPTAPIAGCVPINILGPSDSVVVSGRDYVAFTGASSGLDEQQTLLATTHGRIAKLPNHGDLSAAVGVDVRNDTGKFIPDPVISPNDTTADVRSPATGSSKALEGFGEVSLVPVSGTQYAEWLELDLAARAFRYNSFDNGVTWNVGGLFRPIHGLAIRGTYATAFRAPSIVELYQRRIDPVFKRSTLFGAALQQPHEDAGNPDLAAETARTITAGIVFEPSRVQGLMITIDYWNIETTNEIETASPSLVLSNCFSGGIQSFCDLIHRDPVTNEIVIDSILANGGTTATSGIDLSVGYDRRVSGLGSFHEQLEAQYLFSYDHDGVTHGRGNDALGVLPWLRASLSSTWQHRSGAGAGFNVHYIGSFQGCQQINCSLIDPSRPFYHNVDDWYKIDLFGSYTFRSAAGNTTLSVGINNVFDRAPPAIYIGSASSSDASTYDYLGRLFYARLSQRF